VNRQTRAALRRLGTDKVLLNTAYRPSTTIQDAARMLTRAEWPQMARSLGFGMTLRGAEAVNAVQALGAHQSLVDTRLATPFRKNVPVTVAENVQRTFDLIGAPSRMIEQALQPLRTYRQLFGSIADSIHRFAEQQRDIDEDLESFVIRQGWPVPLNLPMRAYTHIVRMADSPKREVTNSMVHRFRPET